MQQYLEILDLPLVPENYVKEILQAVELFKKKFRIRPAANDFEHCNNPIEENPLGYNKREDILKSLEYNNISENDVALFHTYDIPLPRGLDEWVINNIMPNGITKVFIMGNGKRFLPHVDPRNKVAYNFILRKGGNVKNMFWKPKQEFSDKKIFHTIYLPYERLEKLAEYEIPEKTWCKFNPEIIHSVENLDPDDYRILISVDAQLEKTKYFFSNKKSSL